MNVHVLAVIQSWYNYIRKRVKAMRMNDSTPKVEFMLHLIVIDDHLKTHTSSSCRSCMCKKKALFTIIYPSFITMH